MEGKLIPRILPWIADGVLAGLFLFAALPKVVDPASFARTIGGFQVVPAGLAMPLAVNLPMFELLWAVLLLLGVQRRLARETLVILLLVYILAALSAWGRGIDVSCGCFGGDGGSALSIIVRNTAILAVLSPAWLLDAAGTRIPPTAFPSWWLSLILTVAVSLIATLSALGEDGVEAPPSASDSVEVDDPQDSVSAGHVDVTDLAPGSRHRRTYKPLKDWRGGIMTYWVNLPEDFDAGRRYPILFEWHGRGGSSKTRVFTDTYGVDGHIHVGLTYPLGSRGGTAMLYATPEYVTFMRHVYDDVVENFMGHPDYAFIGGFSAGGFMATGPGISLMIRADLRESLRGVLAGGCNWMCDPRYVRDLNVLLWYGEYDSNSSDLPRRLPDLKRYAASLETIMQPGGGHGCDNGVEGPAIRRFLRLNGPHGQDYRRLYQALDDFESQRTEQAIAVCEAILDEKGPASDFAIDLLRRFESMVPPRAP